MIKLKNMLNWIFLGVYVLLGFVLYIVLQNIEHNAISSTKAQNYQHISQNIKKELTNHIEDKKHTTLSIAIALSQNPSIKQALKNNAPQKVSLEALVKQFKENTDYKNVWIQIIDKDGKSFKRSWTEKSGDDLLSVRNDLKGFFLNPKSTSTISVGKFDMTFKSMVPIFDENEKLLGLFEVITHFNSIAKKMQQEGFKVVIAVEKMYQKQLSKPFTGNFIDGYYIANIGADKDLLEILKKEGIAKFLDINKYTLYEKQNLVIFNFRLFDVHDKLMATFILSQDTQLFEVEKVDAIKTQTKLYFFIGFIILTLMLYFVAQKEHEAVGDIKIKRFKLLIALLSIFLLVSVITVFVIYKLQTSKIDEFLANQTQRELGAYNAYYHQYEELSQTVFNILIDTPRIKKIFANAYDLSDVIKNESRQKLFKELENAYMMLTQSNVRQLHFHLPNNESFLRFHRPAKFGDDLSQIRPTIAVVNKEKKYVHGFEEGRIFSGFRFVYPIENRGKHLGSVEISFSPFSIIENYIDHQGKKANFLISKEVVDKKVFQSELEGSYLKSPVKGFYFDRDIFNRLQDKFSNYNPYKRDAQTLDVVSQKILEGDAFSKYIENTQEVVTWIPISNPITNKVVAVFGVSNPSEYVEDQRRNLFVYSLLFMVLVALVLGFIYKEVFSKIIIEQQSSNFKKMLDNQDGIVIVTNGEFISQANRSFYEFFKVVSLDEFHQKYHNIADKFEFEMGKNYIQKSHFGVLWYEYLLENEKKNNEVMLFDQRGKRHIFDIRIKRFDSIYFVVTMLDITQIKELQDELQRVNETLEQKIALALKENTKQLEVLQQQSKLASMGEMIGSIAHQWRQPLNALSINIQNLEDDYEEDLIDAKFIDQFIEKNRKIIVFMSETIDDFRNFFRIDKEKKNFSVKEVVNDVLSIQSASLKNNNIQCHITGSDFIVVGFKSEFGQVILNIINNAKDAIIEKGIKDGVIDIAIVDNQITIEDNAGGIPSKIINRIFEPYFTTKEQGKGTGIGLYLSKMILEDNMHAKLSAQNTSKGAKFTIGFDKS